MSSLSLQKAGESSTASTATNTSIMQAASASIADLLGSKYRKQLSTTLQESHSAPTSAFAKRQLEKMGWTEGSGLGKNRDGMKTHLRVKKRVEQAGLGTEKAALEKQQQQHADEWWKDSFGNALSKVSGKKRKKDCTDQELFEATGGMRFGMRAAPTTNLGKWQRTNDTITSQGDEDDKEEEIAIVTEYNSSSDEKKDKKKKKKKKKEKTKKSRNTESEGAESGEAQRRKKKKSKKESKQKN